MVATKTLEIPFDSGLSQKVDALWLQPGSASTAQNLVKLKTGSFAKRLGFTTLSTAGVVPSSGGNASASATLTTGKRLFSFNDSLGIIGADAFTDAAWSYDDVAAQAVLLDRVPETYVHAPTTIAGSSPNPAASVPSGRVVQCDTQVASGYEMHVWGVGDPTGGSGADIWYELRSSTTGTVVIPAQALVGSATHGGVDGPKLIAVQQFFVLTYSSAAGGDASIYARVFDSSHPGNGWTAEANVNIGSHDAAYATGIFATPAYDVCASTGESGFMALLYEATVTGTPAVVAVRIGVSAAGTTIVSSVLLGDTTWTADSKPVIQGFAVRADFAAGELAFSCSWTSAAPLTRVSFGIVAWPAYTAVATSRNILATPGPIAPASINAALVIAIERLGSASGLTQVYKIVWSPGQTTFRQGDASSAYPFVASYLVSVVSNVTTVAANQPRVTWNATIASRILPQNGIGYVVVYVPSDVQGSHFVLADDAWSDITTPNQSGGFARGYFPMRLVANLTPRQSSVMSFSSAMMGLTAPQFSRVAVHWALNAGLGASTWQTLLPKDTGPISAAPTIYPVDFASQKNYAPSQLGANALLAGGCPSCFDGSQVFEQGYPNYPVFSLSQSSSGDSGAGVYSYIAVYKWTDGAGQIHQSARSVPTAITLLANKGTTIVIAVPGFSARMKAPNASTTAAGVGPQAHLPRRRNIQVYLYRSIINSPSPIVYYQCQPPKSVQLDAPTVTMTDDFTVSGDINLVAQPLLYGDGSDGTGPGNILDDECPPAFQHAIVHNNRPWGIAGDQVWLGKEFTTFAGVGYNEATAFSVDDGPSRLTALASMDGNLILFKKDRIFLMSGQGPADNGTNNDLTPPQRIASDVGCADWRSVVVTAKGCYFMSAAGRRILTRDLQVTPLPVVEDLDASLPVTTSAVVHPTGGRVLWTQNVDDVSSPRTGGIVLNDYVIESWSETVPVGGSGFVSAAVAKATNGATSALNYYALSAVGRVWQENSVSPGATPYYDAGTFSSMRWVSPWLKTDGLVGWSEWSTIFLLLTLKDPADILVQVYYDYKAAVGQTLTMTAAQLAAQVAPGPPQALVTIGPTNRRAASMRIAISDSASLSTVTGQGFLLEDLRVNYEVVPGGYRTPVSQQG